VVVTAATTLDKAALTRGSLDVVALPEIAVVRHGATRGQELA